MKLRTPIVALIAATTAALAPAAASAADSTFSASNFSGSAPAQTTDSVIVGFDSGVSAGDGSAQLRTAGVAGVETGGPRSAVVKLRAGESPAAAARRLARRPGVKFVKPNYVAHASAEFVPNDPGRGNAGDWRQLQWNFVGTWGVNVEPAWDHLRQLGVEGGRGAVVAIIDTGVAYETIGPYRRSPDLAGVQIHRPWDFIDRDKHANDKNGHGTHVASTIFEQTNNGVGVTGMAYGATLMPLRALDGAGLGDEMTVAKAIRYAAKHGADVINLSVEFDVRLTARHLPTIISAMRYARKRGSLVVAAAGNQAARRVAYPARYTYALAVGATTIRGCLAEYSDTGAGLDLVAPGGGADSGIVDLRAGSTDRDNCSFGGAASTIYQMTFGNSLKRFGLISGYQGTSMATPHVSATAAMVVASGVIGPDPSPAALTDRLTATSKDLGFPGYDSRYGFGLVDAGAALTRP